MCLRGGRGLVHWLGLIPKFDHFFAGFPKCKIYFRHLKLMHSANNLQLRKSIRLLKESGNGCDCAIAWKQTKSAKCNFEWDINGSLQWACLYNPHPSFAILLSRRVWWHSIQMIFLEVFSDELTFAYRSSLSAGLGYLPPATSSEHTFERISFLKAVASMSKNALF